MKALKIDGTKFTPKVVFDPSKGEFQITGFSLPENVSSFYDPILKWLENYFDSLNGNSNSIQFNFNLSYYNSGSFKVIINILLKLAEVSNKGNAINVNWYYDEDDYQLMEIGKELSEMVGIEFKFLTV